MKRTSKWLVPAATVGSAITIAATFVHVAHATRAGEHGGYTVLWFAAIAVGCLTGACVYWSASSQERTAVSAIVYGAVAALAAAGVLLFGLVSAFGS